MTWWMSSWLRSDGTGELGQLYVDGQRELECSSIQLGFGCIDLSPNRLGVVAAYQPWILMWIVRYWSTN